MAAYTIRQITNLDSIELDDLLTQSKMEGFRFVERLVHDYKTGTNKFNNPGEALYGVFDQEEALIAIGGITIDPFSNETKIGRVRRFYVRKEYRRKGIGSLLVNKIILEAKKHFTVLVLYTDTDQADRFYTALDFVKGNLYSHTSHYMDL